MDLSSISVDRIMSAVKKTPRLAPQLAAALRKLADEVDAAAKGRLVDDYDAFGRRRNRPASKARSKALPSGPADKALSAEYDAFGRRRRGRAKA